MARLEFQKGDRLLAEHMTEIVRRLDRLEGVRTSGRLQARRGARGPMELAYVEGVTSSLGMANGDISAGSGTAPGTGSVDFYWLGPSGTLEATGQSEGVLNVDTAITSGKWVWAQQDMVGDWYVSPLQCETA